MQSTQIIQKELRPLRDNDKDYEAVEKQIRAILKEQIYLPLIRSAGGTSRTLQNASDDLLNALITGRVEFYRGTFKGRFGARVSKDLRALGATWDRTTRTFKIPQSSLPIDVRNAISASSSRFEQKLESIDRKLSQILPEEIADHVKISDHFDATLWKVEKEFNSTLKNISVPPQLSKTQISRISSEWQTNTKLSIKDWTQKEIVKLRKDIRESVYAGNRNDSLIEIINKSHDRGINKAKFIARQETRLLLTKFKQTRYEEAGVDWYKWMISNHPIQPAGGKYRKGMVRHDHGRLANRKFRWDDPPITNSETGARNNPGQDFNCRCTATPIVTFKGKK